MLKPVRAAQRQLMDWEPEEIEAMARFFKGLQQLQQAKMEIEKLELDTYSIISEGADTQLLERELMPKAFWKRIRLLSEREQAMLALRFGFAGAPDKTYEEIGEIFNVTRERIRQILNRSLIKLRRKLGIIS